MHQLNQEDGCMPKCLNVSQLSQNTKILSKKLKWEIKHQGQHHSKFFHILNPSTIYRQGRFEWNMRKKEIWHNSEKKQMLRRSKPGTKLSKCMIQFSNYHVYNFILMSEQRTLKIGKYYFKHHLHRHSTNINDMLFKVIKNWLPWIFI